MGIRGRARTGPAAIVTAVLLLVGCGGGGDTAADSGALDGGEAAADHDASFGDVGAAETTDDASRDAGGEGGADGGERSQPASTAFGQRLIRTATLELQDADPSAVADGINTVVEQAGGFVSTADLRRDADGVLNGSITVRVPSGELDTTLDRLEALADNAPLRRIEEQNVTTESADLQAQLRNLEAFETELRRLLAEVGENTSRPEDLLTIYERIREVRADIDQVEGRLSLLDDQVSLATVTIRLTPTIDAVPVTDPGWAPGETIRAALSTGIRALTTIADAAIWIGLAVVPVVAVAALPLAAVWLVWRRRDDGRPDGSSPTMAPPNP